MAASSLIGAEAATAESRRESSVGNFPDALRILTTLDATSSSAHAVRGELLRICIILGDHKQIAVTSTVNPLVTQQGHELYNDLFTIQIGLSRISTDGELAQSLQSATSLFQKHKNMLESENSDGVVVS
jgi:hypothetical protein